MTGNHQYIINTDICISLDAIFQVNAIDKPPGSNVGNSNQILLNQVSASYSKRSDGGVDVINRGFNSPAGKWKEAKGRAYFIGEPDVARLKVTFFWPFYGGYNVIELDHANYSYALICGPNKKYLWILARTKKLDASITEALIDKAKDLGFNTGELILVEQEE